MGWTVASRKTLGTRPKIIGVGVKLAGALGCAERCWLAGEGTGIR